MQMMKRDGVALAFKDFGGRGRPLLLVHGCGCDHTTLCAQEDALRSLGRVISFDLRGHGKSDAPKGDYTMEVFASDVAWLADRLGLRNALIVGHSMGGNIGMELAAQRPDIVAGLMMVDSCAFLNEEMRTAITPMIAATSGPEYLEPFRKALLSMILPREVQSLEIASGLCVPQHVLAPALASHTVDYDCAAASSRCSSPVAYIGAANPFVDLTRFKESLPQLQVGHTLLSGHFAPLEVPSQINGMIEAFLMTLRP